MSESPGSARVKFTSPAALPGVELVHAHYPTRAFPTHSHREFVIGVVVDGAESLEVGRQNHIATAGSSLLLQPEQAHANASIPPSPLDYRVLYIPTTTMTDWLETDLSFACPVSTCPALYHRIRDTHLSLEQSTGRLEQESAFSTLMEEVRRSSQPCPPLHRTDPAPAGMKRVRDYIDANYDSDFGLEQLSAVAGVSRFHLIRAFKKATGLSPLAFRNQRRIEEARRMLRGQQTITQIALALGYADHAHMTRHFQRIVGTSPSRYRAQ